VELGLAIKKASPFYYTFIAEWRTAPCYIPNREAYAQGNYEVVSARCAEGSGELLVHIRHSSTEEAAENKVSYRPVFSRMIAPRLRLSFFLVRRHVADAAKSIARAVEEVGALFRFAHDFCE